MFNKQPMIFLYLNVFIFTCLPVSVLKAALHCSTTVRYIENQHMSPGHSPHLEKQRVRKDGFGNIGNYEQLM